MRVMNDGRISTKEIREEQALYIAEYMLKNDSRIMDMERALGIPHTTIHRRLTITLPEIDYQKWEICDEMLFNHRLEHRKPSKKRA